MDNALSCEGENEMSEATNRSNTANTAQSQPAFEGATKIVVLNGSRIVMNYRDGQWWNDRVSAA